MTSIFIFAVVVLALAIIGKKLFRAHGDGIVRDIVLAILGAVVLIVIAHYNLWWVIGVLVIIGLWGIFEEA